MTHEEVMEFQHINRIDSARHHIQGAAQIWRFCCSQEAALFFVGMDNAPVTVNCTLENRA